MTKRLSTAFLFIITVSFAHAQGVVDKAKFFSDTAMVNASLRFDMKKLLAMKDVPKLLFPATFSCKLDDGMVVNDLIALEVRGHFRRAYCSLVPLKLIYKQNPSAAFFNFKELKLVNTCMPSLADDQNLLKEYLVYKMYNLLTEKSFRVRLLKMSFIDSAGKKATINEHAFLVEEVKDLAKRNGCKDVKEETVIARLTDRHQMIVASVFEYMIGNTDWSIPAKHNIRIIKSRTDSTAMPFIVPYDFDFSGLVNTSYSTPDERLGIQTVKDRLYRGLPISKEELMPVLDDFKKSKTAVYAIINDFSLLSVKSKKEMTNYLNDFFATINSPKDTQDAFLSSK